MFVSVVQRQDEIVNLSHFAGVGYLSVGGVVFAPADIVGDGSGERVLFCMTVLYFSAQIFWMVALYVYSVYLYGSCGDLVKSGNEVG